MRSCDCHSCELGDYATCTGCPIHGAWCDWVGDGTMCGLQRQSAGDQQ